MDVMLDCMQAGRHTVLTIGAALLLLWTHNSMDCSWAVNMIYTTQTLGSDVTWHNFHLSVCPSVRLSQQEAFSVDMSMSCCAVALDSTRTLYFLSVSMSDAASSIPLTLSLASSRVSRYRKPFQTWKPYYWVSQSTVRWVTSALYTALISVTFTYSK